MKIWTGQFLNENKPLYNMILAYEIRGEVDITRFENAFQKLVDTNDVFRSVIQLKDEMPVQVFYEKAKSTLEIIDFSIHKDAYQQYEEWVENHKTKIFEIGSFLYHAFLFKLADDQFIFYLNQYHLITDGWSMKYVYDQLNAYYSKDKEDENDSTKSSFTFESYARENSFDCDQEISNFWQKKMENLNSIPSLYGVKLKNTSSNATRINLELGKERTQKLKELAQDKDIRAWTTELALSNVFLTLVAALIYKIGDQETFSIGVPFHNRTSAKEKQIAGLFMELLPIDVRIEKEETLIGLFQKIKSESFEVTKNAVSSKPPVELLKTFNVLLNYIPVSLGDFSGMPMNCKWLFAEHMDANHHIRLQIQEFNYGGDYTLQFDLNNDIFPKQDVNYVTNHFLLLVDAFIDDRSQKLKDIHLVTDEEIRRINSWNATDEAYEENETILTQFERQVIKSPDSVALIYKGESLTYRALNEKSNQLAHFLIEKGIQTNDIVAVSLDRSIEMMICIYGILKSGASYLPLDPKTPQKRLKFILEDTKSRLLFYNHAEIETDALDRVECIQPKVIESKIAMYPIDKPDVLITPDTIAYVIYTSGSTGEPKGVMCHHGGVCNRLNWMQQKYPISKEDTMIQKTPITFDVSVPELFFPLQIGARLVVPIPEVHKDAEGLIKTIKECNVTIIHFVPSMLNVFIDTDGVETCQNLKIIFCSGEALSAATVEKTYSKLDKIKIQNLYGPTEASVEVSTWCCDRNQIEKGIPIGHPVPNTQLHILDEQLNVVPIGVVGELHIAGSQVSKGYLNRKELTEQRFIEDIFSQNAEAKMYKTGDLARYRSDGAIEYLGRIDNQIKLRGLRIELGEIENAIAKLNGISQAVLRLEKHENNQDCLVAFYSGEKINEKSIKRSLRESLPEYMIPTFFVHVDKFVLLSSGKVNRKKLPLFKLNSKENDKAFTAPSNEIEEIIANVWREVLNLNSIGIDDNFIYIGGNSLNAILVTSRLKVAFDLESLSIADVFIYSTIRAYAMYIERVIIGLLEQEA